VEPGLEPNSPDRVRLRSAGIRGAPCPNSCPTAASWLSESRACGHSTLCVRGTLRGNVNNRPVADSTVVTVVAVLVAGVAGPGITAWATTRGQARKFRHERAASDTAEVRRLLDDTGGALSDMIRYLAGVGALIHQVGIGEAASSVLSELEQKIEDFQATSAHLTIRCGPNTEIAAVCSQLVATAESIEAELTYIGVMIRRLDSDRNDDAEREKLSQLFLDAVEKVRGSATALRELRPAYVLAAHRLAGAELGGTS
jgi:hypothetical protein